MVEDGLEELREGMAFFQGAEVGEQLAKAAEQFERA